MKNINLKTSIISSLMLALLLISCSDDILEETPRATFEPSFFQTEEGVLGGLTSMYAHLRYIYGQGYYYNASETGTDEYTYGANGDQNFLVMDLSGQGNITSSTSRADVLWNAVYSNINTASGIVENGTEVGVSDELLAEARFFRGFDYFLLVQTFGGVPLDLGAGELVFNTNPVRTSVRNTVPEVYTRTVFPDLLNAVDNLPEYPRVTGGATKTVARLYLAKAYLTYGWWLENPNNIPTYPEAPRTDPDGHDAQWYYQQAYDVATTAINNPGPFGLQPTYYDVNNAENDRNNEILLYADHTETSQFYNGGSLTYGTGSAPDNFAGWMVTWNYTIIRSATTPNWEETVSSVQREAAQKYGRPWTTMAPTIGAITETFNNKDQDSRYDGTFTTVYRGNWPKGNIDQGVLYNANGLPVEPGDAILTFLDEQPETAINYPDGPGKSNVGGGELPGRSDFVIAPMGINRIAYPSLWKIGTYRTDNGEGLGQPNAGSTRPWSIAKFSELYFIAAEAAVQGANATGMSARDLINVIRARAGVWRWDKSEEEPKIADFSDELVSNTPAEIDIDYILAERSREYFGEGYRWYDLVRTQKWEEKASTYRIGGSTFGDHTPQTITRNIEPYLYLRPIPQNQLDAMEGDVEAYQNPGYN
ncbi:RagB/SusD family nutrient uptake outer membrane protein [Zunongwangia sp. F363]|uniref:RagB/SusD family nutrient uptake outer membrane protein n=1 Tax=Autumnicola tepida TaxID=3075595 RepID=A0ABU3CB61_9FLAO|nr:RagB/SusD family nutrient uptake outer membrane protein [Zunongwangia sp. F363]MDT0643569.1 RagB/SusD family nutrient uptake outer membrane protein [Zunongwangia sp. F363]